jgi:RNA polymerase sigma-70 factor (ECF subfamily)
MAKFDIRQLLAAFNQARPRLEGIARGRVGSRETAEDLMQDTWLKLAGANGDAAVENPAGFVTKVAGNTVLDHLRKERRRAEIDAEVQGILWERQDEFSPERVAIGRDMLRAVQAVLDAMPEKSRRIFLMNRLEGVSHRQIACQLGMSEEAVYYHIRRVLDRLAELRDTKS